MSVSVATGMSARSGSQKARGLLACDEAGATTTYEFGTTPYNLPFLGGLPDGAAAASDCTFPDDWNYATKLSRPPCLPPLRSKDKAFASLDAKRLFLQVRLGKCKMRVAGLNGDGIFGLAVLRDDAQEDANSPVTHDKFVALVSMTPKHILNLMSIGPCNKTYDVILESFVDGLSDRQQDLLALTGLHRFYRSHAAQLAPELRFSIYQQLIVDYQSLGLFHDCVDVTVAFTDASISAGNFDETADFLVKTGEALAAAERHFDAALVYNDVARGLGEEWPLMTNRSGRQNESLTRSFEALAYKRAGEYALSEQASLQGIWVHFTRDGSDSGLIDFSGEDVQVLLGNFQTMYQAWNNMEIADLLPIFLAILYTAGYAPNESYPQLSRENINMFKGLTKSECVSSRKAATKSLRAIFATSSVDDFHSTLRSYQNALQRSNRFALKAGGDKDAKERAAIDKRLAREIAKKESGSRGPVSVAYARCSNADCPEEFGYSSSLKACACKNVRYCCRECQLADWSMHKKVCQFHLARKKKNSSKS